MAEPESAPARAPRPLRPLPFLRRTAPAAVAAFTVLLGGCSLFVPKFTAPRLSVVSITMGRSDLLQQHLLVRMRVENPNDRALPVQGLSYTFQVNGDELAHGMSNASFIVPARGEAEFDTSVTTNMAIAMLRLLGRNGSAGGLSYRLYGKVQLSAGLLRSVPFEKTGVVDLH